MPTVTSYICKFQSMICNSRKYHLYTKTFPFVHFEPLKLLYITYYFVKLTVIKVSGDTTNCPFTVLLRLFLPHYYHSSSYSSNINFLKWLYELHSSNLHRLYKMWKVNFFYMPPTWKIRRGHLVIGSSVRPSVCPSVCLSVRNSVPLTIKVL